MELSNIRDDFATETGSKAVSALVDFAAMKRERREEESRFASAMKDFGEEAWMRSVHCWRVEGGRCSRMAMSAIPRTRSPFVSFMAMYCAVCWMSSEGGDVIDVVSIVPRFSCCNAAFPGRSFPMSE